MSFILDALRKSEQERQRHQHPGVADLRGRGGASNRTYWLPIVIFLLGLNIGLLMFLWLNSEPTAESPVVRAPAAEPPAETTPAVAASSSTTLPAAVTLPSGEATTPPPAAQSSRASVQQRDLANELMPRPSPAASPATAVATTTIDRAPENAYRNLPTLTELTMAGSMSLTPLRIDMHVFSPRPAERFVFINMNKYREGDSLREGPVLSAITEDGVVLDYQGRSFLVTRE